MNITTSGGYRCQVKKSSNTDDTHTACNRANRFTATKKTEHGQKEANHFHRRKSQAVTNASNFLGDTADEVVLSEKFKKSITNLNRYSSIAKKEIGLMVRFNNNDALADVFWSEQYTFLHQGTVSFGFKREKVTRMVLKKGVYDKSTAQPDLGGHSEEIFIRSWQGLLKYNKCYPKVVDIVLSHSPCMNHSALLLDEGGHLWPAGCAPKLYKLISGQKQVSQWNIIYLQKNSEHCADAAIAKLNRHPRVRVFTCEISTNISLSRVT
ncbi:hypothetical protein [Endozoicomonas sp. SESOKO1]|uniref:hypothetical protein n=1 Tax=Endozoicomonas sp. SESOKO1 TaxID=2828742 RepID=UPI002148B7B8|nr:hypothetical protein [Endozoicomonas sp. SESOKO1]